MNVHKVTFANRRAGGGGVQAMQLSGGESLCPGTSLLSEPITAEDPGRGGRSTQVVKYKYSDHEVKYK